MGVKSKETKRCACCGQIIRENKGIGGLIFLLRSDKQWSLDDLSETSGISKSTLSKIENGKGDITLNTLYSVALALEISASELLQRQSERKKL